ncbi:type I-E CRISPR-associated endoribonuclease Cas2e, partial [Aerococcus urinae]
MPLTVITMKNCPPSLRGDLSKWMQEIATGVYVGNFNSRVREALWERVSQNVGVG